MTNRLFANNPKKWMKKSYAKKVLGYFLICPLPRMKYFVVVKC
jgi:hypothetical protein